MPHHVSLSAEGMGRGKVMGSSPLSDRVGNSMGTINGVSPVLTMPSTSVVTSMAGTKKKLPTSRSSTSLALLG